MDENNVERLKKIIEEKKKNSEANDPNVRPDKSLGGKSHQTFNNKKTGGSLNK